MQLRTATTADIPELVRLRAVMLADLGTDPGGQDERWRRCARTWFEQRIAGREDWTCLVAGAGPGGRLLATGMAWETYHLPGPERTDGRRGYIDGMVTDRPARGMGHARRIVDALVAWLDSRGIRYVQLHASPSGAPVYAAAGFTCARYPAMDLMTEQVGHQ